LTGERANSVNNTIDLLENLLVWASEQIKGKAINIVKLNLYEIANDNVALLSGNAAQKNIELENLVDEDAMAYGDLDTINLVVCNAYFKCYKIYPRRGSVSISSNIHEKFIHISVLDNGVGISKVEFLSFLPNIKTIVPRVLEMRKALDLGLCCVKNTLKKTKDKYGWRANRKRLMFFV
jgi:signal transduction histidine kinase